jgi:serine phosphatase RsbU (regulator of sigma subunit)
MWIKFCASLSAQNISDLLAQLNQTKDAEQKVSIYIQIGSLYQQQKAYSKAAEYFLQAHKNINANISLRKEIEILEYLGTAQSLIPDYEASLKTYQTIFEKQKNSPSQARKILGIMADLHKRAEQYPQALSKYEDILTKYPPTSPEQTIQTYNNIGYLYRQAGNNSKALGSLEKAFNLAKNSGSKQSQITTLFNLGVTYSVNNDYQKAFYYFQEAKNIAEQNNLARLVAESQNYLAANHWLQNKPDNALESVQNAIKIAEPLQANDILVVSYQLLSEIYQQKGELKEAQQAYRKYEQLKNQRIEKAQKEEKARLENQFNIEKKENEIKELMAEKDRQKSALRQSELEKQQKDQELIIKQKELDLYKSNQERQKMQLANQLLEQKRVEQMLEITRRKLQEDKQNQEIQRLATEKRLQDALLKQREAEQKERKKELELSKKDQKIKEQQLKDEKLFRQYANWVISLIVICLLLVLVGLFYTFWSNRKLKTQQIFILKQKSELEEKNQEISAISAEIMSQNEELQQNQEEILAQRDFIAKQNEQLGETNAKLMANEEILKKSLDKIRKSEAAIKEANLVLAERDRQITSSINAAISIQTAVLPYKQKLDDLLKEYFVIYKPKDMVSGDFYWLNKIHHKIYLAAVDCTGHGVPGAFMSLIANNLLDKIIRVWDIYSPEEILERMHQEVQIVLRQNETDNNSGMDMGILVMERNENGAKILFAGARRPMYYILPQSNEVEELKK